MRRRGSIRTRLFLVGAAAIAVALALAAFGLSLLFDRHAERVAVADLDARAMALIATIGPSDGDVSRLSENRIDPRYELPFSGHYWQITIGAQHLQSRSLWDVTLKVPDLPPAPGETRVAHLTGPQQEDLLAVDRSLVIAARQGAIPLRVVVATDRAELTQARFAFLGDLAPFLVFLGSLLLLVSWVQVTVGLRPLNRIGARVAALAAGDRQRMGTDLPQEVVPLASQIDALLDARDAQLGRARHRAADLAHGFKTPLQGLMGDADQLRARGEGEVADNIETLVGAMRGLVDRELTRARIQSDHAASATDPVALLERMLKVLRRMPRGAELEWRLHVDTRSPVRIDRHDLTEALGALLENAMRHAASAIDITVAEDPAGIAITIRDDGAGAEPEKLASLVKRGVSLDEKGGGQGIGLSIASDIIEAALGELHLTNAFPGLSARIVLHRAARQAG